MHTHIYIDWYPWSNICPCKRIYWRTSNIRRCIRNGEEGTKNSSRCCPMSNKYYITSFTYIHTGYRILTRFFSPFEYITKQLEVELLDLTCSLSVNCDVLNIMYM